MDENLNFDLFLVRLGEKAPENKAPGSNAAYKPESTSDISVYQISCWHNCNGVETMTTILNFWLFGPFSGAKWPKTLIWLISAI